MENNASQPLVLIEEPRPRDKTTGNILLGIGIVAIFSLIVGNGLLLQVSALVFLVMAIFAIVQSVSAGKAAEAAAPSVPLAPGQPPTVAKKPTSPWKVLGITLLIIVGLPVLGYVVLIGLFIFMMSAGGGASS